MTRDTRFEVPFWIKWFAIRDPIGTLQNSESFCDAMVRFNFGCNSQIYCGCMRWPGWVWDFPAWNVVPVCPCTHLLHKRILIVVLGMVAKYVCVFVMLWSVHLTVCVCLRSNYCMYSSVNMLKGACNEKSNFPSSNLAWNELDVLHSFQHSKLPLQSKKSIYWNETAKMTCSERFWHQIHSFTHN